MFRYTTQQIVLHWTIVLLVIFQYLWNGPMGQAFGRLMRGGDKVLGPVALAHLVVGVTILAITIWRLALRRRAPAAPHGRTGLDRITVLIHALLHIVLIAIPLAGLAAWFGGIGRAGDLHVLLTDLLLVLAGLHVAAALYHHFVLKDGLMNRLRPRR